METFKKILTGIGEVVVGVLVVALIVAIFSALIGSGPIGWIILILLLGNRSTPEPQVVTYQPSFDTAALSQGLRDLSKSTREAVEHLDRLPFPSATPDTFPKEWLNTKR